MTTTPGPAEREDVFAREQEGYRQGLKRRQLQMIGIGGAIGSGLFLGAGGRLASAGPALFVVYAFCGFFAFVILRALGELVLYRRSSGSFVSYAREFLGEKAAFVTGWVYSIGWALTAIADSTAIATYFQYWSTFDSIPQWVIALIALALVFGMNLIAVSVFGELEYWAAIVKVVALGTFLVVGTVFVVGRFRIQGRTTGIDVIADSGGLIPTGVLPLVMVTSGVVFAYAAIELVGTAAGETADAHEVIPRAVNLVIARVAVFYVGSVLLLGLLLPHTVYQAGESPFVTFFAKVGLHGAGTLMNIVVLTAAFSSLNAGLYSTGRIMRSIALSGSAPKVMLKMSRRGVPYPGICFTAVVGLFGVLLNGVVPDKAFEIVLNMTALGIVTCWGTIIVCQIQLFRRSKRGVVARPSFRLFGAPYTGYATLVFLAAVLVLIGFNYPIGTWTVATLVVIVPALIVGWYAARGRGLAVSASPDR
jgi:L-asparagine permease